VAVAKNKGSYSSRRSDIPVTDQFVATTLSLADRLEPHKRSIVVVLVLIVAGTALWAIYDSRQRKERQAASATYAEAARLALLPVASEGTIQRLEGTDDKRAISFKDDKSKNEAVLAELERLKKENGSTPIWKQALPLYAQTFYNLGRFDQSVTAYREALAAAEDPVVKAEVQEGLAYALEAQALAKTDAAARQAGLEQALKEFEAASAASLEEEALTASLAAYHRGRILLALGKNSEARAAWQKLLTDNPETPLRPLVEVRMAMLDSPHAEKKSAPPGQPTPQPPSPN
jgi:predicted negative regulator of RcsB-dependent stress response